MIYALNFPLSLFLSIALVPICMRYANVMGLVDKPDGVRKIHTKLIPKSGGLAIVIAVLIPILYSIHQLTQLLPLLAGALVIVIFGLIDDRYEINFKWKFLGQIIAILIFLIGTPELLEKPLFYSQIFPEWTTKVILFVFLLGVSNAINLSDGLDGLAAGITMISLGLIALLANSAELTSVLIVSMALMGALMGFLRYNTHPAQVFMGDTGSQFIGYTCAALAVYLSQYAGAAISPVLPVLVLGVPIMDTLMVMSVRMYAGKSPFYPDKNHIHHQLMKFGFRHYEAVAILYIVQILLICSTYFLRYKSELILISFYCLFAFLCLGFLFLANYKKWKFRSDITDTGLVERRNPILRSMNWIYRSSTTVVSGCFCAALAILSFFTINSHVAIFKLSILLLLVIFITGILFPKLNLLTTRMLSYSATTLLLYLFTVYNENSLIGNFLNGIFIFLGIFLLLSIRMTRKEQFQLNNQDLIILFILLIGPLLPFEGKDSAKIGAMLFKMSILIYAIEYVISKSPKHNFLIKCFSTLTLFSVCFIK